jgi:DNA-binding NarL/FixJ family response regulator
MKILLLEDDRSVRSLLLAQLHKYLPESVIIHKDESITAPLDIAILKPDVIISDYNFKTHTAKSILPILNTCNSDVYFFTSDPEQVKLDLIELNCTKECKVYCKTSSFKYIINSIMKKYQLV